jgi:hypothetical protein
LPRGRPRGSKNKETPIFTDTPSKEGSKSSYPRDILSLIRLCSRYNVSEVKCGDFFVSFHGPKAPGVGQMSKAVGVKTSAPKVENLPPEVIRDEFERLLMIEDPVAFEQQQIDADIQRGHLETKDNYGS